MTSRHLLTLILIAAASLVASGNASAQSSSMQLTISPSDVFFDFEVYMADDVQPVYHVKVQNLDGTWEFERELHYNAATETVWYGRKTEWSSHWRANRYGQRLKDRGEILNYQVIEHWPAPNWEFAAKFDTLAEGQWMANWIEDFMGKNTKINSVSAFYFYGR